MKINVDLTDSRIFSRNLISELNDLLKTLVNKYPWNMNYIKSDSELNPRKLILEGTATERKSTREYIKLDGINYCDCCGRPMNLKPWIQELGVCLQCRDRYEYKDRCEWRQNKKSASI